MSAAERVVVLGGGIGGLTAAYELSDPKLEGRYEVTVYQMGWKLGGKGASGRNRDDHDRIEEHGLHVWFRSYANAIAMMHDVYDEYAKLPCGQKSDFQSFDEAFQPQDLYVFQELYEGQWRSFPVDMPEYPPANNPWEQIIQLIAGLLHVSSTLPKPGSDDPAGRDHPHAHRFFAETLDRLEAAAEHGFHVVGHDAHTLLEKLLEHMKAMPAPAEHSHAQHRFLVDVLQLVDNLAWAAAWPWIHGHFTIRMAWRAFHLGLSCISGILKDGLLEHGYDVIDDQEYMAWAKSHSPLWKIWGALKHEADGLAFDTSPFVRPFYDAAFAYAEGDPKKPSIAAGVGMRSCLRLLLQGTGPLAREMRAGMGDTIFSPLYEVLRARGVRFEFFQRVEDLAPSDDGEQVESIALSQQVRLTGAYEPLFWVKNVQCWPTEPFAEHIDPEDAKRIPGHDLGHYDSGWTDTGPTSVLRAGEDFDRVVLAISVGCHPRVCSDLLALRPGWKAMVEGLASCRTLATQLWFQKDAKGLGAPAGAPLTGAYIEPLSSLADFTHLIPRENWPAQETPGYLAYACGCMKDGEITQEEAHARTKELTRQLLADHAKPLWPLALGPDGQFQWNDLYGGRAGDPDASLAAQYFRANIDPAELYVQSLPGSNRVRLKAGESGFRNLVFAGTWIDTGMNVSCVETAVISGKQAARAVRGDDTPIEGESDFRDPRL